MRVQQGEATITDPGARLLQRSANVFKCCHGGELVHTATLRSHEYGICFNCDDGKGRGLRCNRPEHQECVHFMKRLEEEETRGRLLQSAGS
jgi:hypothetical protein